MLYKCILSWPFAVTLDALASPVHLKLKYHNVHDEVVTISVDLSIAKRIYKAFEHDLKEGEDSVIKINVASLIGKLKDMDVQPPA